MPRYNYVRDEDTGESKMILVNTEMPPEEGVPTPPTLPEVQSAELKEVHKCMVCDQDYAIAALAAKHFRSEHEDINQNKDTWRDYVEKVEVVA